AASHRPSSAGGAAGWPTWASTTQCCSMTVRGLLSPWGRWPQRSRRCARSNHDLATGDVGGLPGDPGGGVGGEEECRIGAVGRGAPACDRELLLDHLVADRLRDPLLLLLREDRRGRKRV